MPILNSLSRSSAAGELNAEPEEQSVESSEQVCGVSGFEGWISSLLTIGVASTQTRKPQDTGNRGKETICLVVTDRYS